MVTSVQVGMQSADNVKDGSETRLRAQGEQGKFITETLHETLRQPVTNVWLTGKEEMLALVLNTDS